MPNDVDIFLCAFWPYGFFRNLFIQVLCPFIIGLFVVLLLSCRSSFIPHTKPLSDVYIYILFSPILQVVFYFLNNVLYAQMLLILMKSNLSTFSFVAYAFGVISENALSNLRS